MPHGNKLFSYIVNSCGYLNNHKKIALSLAKLNGLTGAEAEFGNMF
jgi:hypothetical protein